MKNSKLSILLLFLVMILAISAVSAADTNETSDSAVQAVDEAPVNEVPSADVDAVAAADNTAVLADPGDKNFTQLQAEIDQSTTGMITLNSNYVRQDGESDIVINKNFNIFGNDVYTIDANNKGGIFKINQGSSVLLNNVVLINGNGINGGAIYNEGTVNIISSTLTGNDASNGGAIYSTGIVTISGSTINENTAAKGGAIYSTGNLVVGDGNNFKDNTATFKGGAIYNEGDLEVTGSTFDSNDITNRAGANTDFNGGAAIYNLKGTLTVDNSNFINNVKNYEIRSATDFDNLDGAITSISGTVAISNSEFRNNSARYGSAILISSLGDGADGIFTIDTCQFYDNLALAGAIQVWDRNNKFEFTVLDSWFENNTATGITDPDHTAAGGALALINVKEAKINGTTFKENKVTNIAKKPKGGAINIQDSNVDIDYCTFEANHADTNGGAINVYSGSVDVNNSEFINNDAAINGGAINIDNNTAYGYAIGTATVEGSTFTGNTAAAGNAIYNNGYLALSGNTVDDGANIASQGTITSPVKAVVTADKPEYRIEEVTLTANLTDDNGNAINDTAFKFIFNTPAGLAAIPATLNDEGKYVAKFTPTKTGEYIVTADYVGVINATFTVYRTLSDLADKIAAANGNPVVLDGDYTYNAEFDSAIKTAGGIAIGSDVTIDGNGYTIDAKNATRIFNVKADMNITNVTLTNGYTTGLGAAINIATAGNNVRVTYTTFTNNAARYGSGICDDVGDGSNVYVDHCIFDSNYNSVTDTVFCGAPAIYSWGSLVVNNSVFNNNGLYSLSNYDVTNAAVTTQGDGSIYNSNFTNNKANKGGAICSNRNSKVINLIVDNCRFINNTGYDGGAVLVNTNSKADIKNSYFENNSALGFGSPGYTAAGGAICVVGANSAEIDNCIFKENKVGVAANSSGGAISIENTKVDISDCTFESNSAMKCGGAIDISNRESTTAREVTISNCNFTNNSAEFGDAIMLRESKTELDVSGSNFTDNGAETDYAVYNMFGALKLSGNTIDNMIYSNDTIISQINVTTNNAVVHYGEKINLTATVTDDNGNLIDVDDFYFVIDTVNYGPAVFNAATGLYEFEQEFSLTLGTYEITMNSTKFADLTYVEIGNLTAVPKKGTYSDLQAQIDALTSGEVLELTYDFAYDASYDADRFPNGVIISKDLTINGNDHYIDGNNTVRIFASFATVNLNDVVFKNGKATKGGAVYTTGNLNIDNCTFINNTATVNGNDIYVDVAPYQVYLVYDEASYNAAYNGTDSPLYKYYQKYPTEDIDNNDPRGHSWTAAISAPVGATVPAGKSRFPWIVLNMNESFTGAIIVNFNGTQVFGPWNVADKVFAIISVPGSDDCGMVEYALDKDTGYADKELETQLFEAFFADDDGVMSATTNPDKLVSVSDSTFTDNAGGYSIYNLGNLELDGNTISNGVYNEGNITSEYTATVLDNKTVNVTASTYELNATLTDDSGNNIYDPNLRFTVDGVEIVNQPLYSNGVYTFTYDLFTTDSPSYLIGVDNITLDGLVVKTGVIVNILRGTFTDLQQRIEASNGDLVLPYDFTYDAEIDGDNFINGIALTKNIVGNGSLIDANGANVNIFVINAGSDVKISNVTITGVNRASNKNYGAVVNHGSLTVEDVVFADNKINRIAGYNAGVAIFNDGTALTVVNSQFINNTSPHNFEATSGKTIQDSVGAIYSTATSGVYIKDSYFEANIGRWGAAITFENLNQATVAVENCTFFNNTAYQGGAININEGAKYVNITNCTFDSNSFRGPAGIPQTGANGAAISVGIDVPVTLEIKDSIFKNNKGDDINPCAGVAIRLADYATGIITNCTFENNGKGHGSAINVGTYYGSAGGLTLKNSTFINSIADENIMVFINPNVVASIENCTFENNGANYTIESMGTLTLNKNTINAALAIMNVNGTINSEVKAVFIDGKNITAALGETVIANATLTDDWGNPIYDPEFNITVGDAELETSYDDVTKLYTAIYTIETAGNKTVSTRYAANITKGKYVVDRANVTEFTVSADDIVEGENATVFIRLYGVNNQGLNTTVTVILNDTEYTIDVVNGTGNRTFEGLTGGAYPVVAMFIDANGNYNTAIDSIVFYVKTATTLIVSPDDDDFDYGENVTIYFTLTDAEGNILQISDVVYVYINDEFYDEVLIKNGEGSIEVIGLETGEYYVIAQYLGDTIYNASQNATSFVIKNETEFNVTIEGTYPDVTITVEGPDGNYTISIEDLLVDVEVIGGRGVNFTALDAGEHEADVLFYGNDQYSSASKTIEFTIDPAAAPEFNVTVETIDETYPGNVTITVVSDADGYAYITVYNENGGIVTYGSLQINETLVLSGLDAGKYTVNATFNAGSNYETGEGSADFTVDKATPEFTYAVGDADFPDALPIYVNASVAGKVIITLDDIFECNVEAGVTTVYVEGLAAGNYTGTITFDAGDNYYVLDGDLTAEINKGTPEIIVNVDVLDVTYPGSINVTIIGPDGSYTVVADGQFIYLNVTGGIASTIVSNISAGNKVVGVDFDGNDNYNESYVLSDNFVIAKATPEISAVAADVWIGNNATVIVTVPSDAEGDVTITVNGKKYTAEIDSGIATATIDADDLFIGENAIDVTFAGDDNYSPNFNSTTVFVLDGVITNETYKHYFDASGNLVSIVPNEVTLDFQGLFLGKYPVYINKAVNVISSTEDALFDCGASYAGNNINSFNMIAGSDHSNITGLSFINYCLYIKGASYITVDGVSIVANKRGVGSGTGFLSIHTGAYYTTVKNGYFENGGTGSSLLVLGKGGAYVVFDHNIFNITGSSGNILSANQFVGTGDAPEHVSYTNNVLYNNQPGSAFCYAMTVSGSGNLVENNTIYHNGSGILNQYGASSTGNVYRNNTLYGNTNFNPSANSIVENNKIYATTNIAANTTVSGNTFTTVAISGTDTKFTNNTVTGTVTVKGNNNELKENNITSTGDYTIDLGSKTGNTVTDNVLIANGKYGDVAVKYTNANNVVENNTPVANIEIVAESVWLGNNQTIAVTIVNGTGNVTIKVNEKEYTVDLTDGVAIQEFAAEDLIYGVNTVLVTYNGGSYIPANETAIFNVIAGIITNDTFFAYFDEDGFIVDAVPENAELTFVGEFSDLTDYIIITKPVKMTGFDAVLYDMAFVLSADDIVLDNMNLTAAGSLGDLIGVYGNGITVSNMNIGYVVGDEAASAINVADVEDVNIVNNTINFESHMSQDNYACAINVEGASDVLIDNNVIYADMAAVNSNWALYYSYGMMGIDKAHAVRIVQSEGIEFTNNVLETTVNGLNGQSPTVEAILVVDSEDILVDGNNVTLVDDFTPAGNVSYLYAMTIGIDDKMVISNNNFRISTESGKNGDGAAYGIQLVDCNVDIVKNNITSVSNGPNLGVYVSYSYSFDYMMDEFEVYIAENNINITGYATGTASTALVSGIEVGAGISEITKNNISVYNKAGYVEKAHVYGISYIQSSYMPDITVNNNVINVEDGDYAININYARIEDLSVTENYLAAHNRYGDKAVITKFRDAVIKDNTPLAEISIEAANVWIGSGNTVTVTIPNALGNVTISVNGKEQSVELVNGVANATFAAEDLIAGENMVEVTYDDISFAKATNSTTFQVLNGVITNATYAYYFENGNLVDIVPEGATLDFQGLFAGAFTVKIDKPVNVISSTGDAVFDSESHSGNSVYSFNIVAGGDHTNITGLSFVNYCLYIQGASYVTVDGISMVANVRGVGSGTGFLSIHSNAYYTTVKNCYMENGGTGSSVLVLGKGGKYASFDNNIINITGSSGNVLSSNVFVGSGELPQCVNYTNNVINSNVGASATMYGITVCGQGNIIENNTLNNFKGNGIVNQFGATSTKNIYRNNTITGGGSMAVGTYSLVENNNIAATVTITEGCTAIGNIVNGLTISGKDVEAYNNIVNGAVTISGANVEFTDNVVFGTVNVNSNGNTIMYNNITTTGDYAVNLNAKTGNTVTDNILIADEFYGDDAVAYTDESNTVEDNYPMDIALLVSADPIYVGEDAKIIVTTIEDFSGIVTVVVNGKIENVAVINGEGSVTVSGLPANNHTVVASFDGDDYFNPDEDETILTVYRLPSEMTIITDEAVIFEDLEVTLILPDVTANVTIIVDGNVDTASIIDGVGTYIIPGYLMEAGDHTIIAVFGGNSVYEPTIAEENFTVEKVDDYTFVLNLTVDEISVGEDLTFNVILPEDANGVITVTVDDEEITFADVVNGSATVTIPASAFTGGDYNEIGVAYSDDKYDDTAVYTDVFVNKLSTHLIAFADNITIGQNAVITVIIPGAPDSTYVTVELLGETYDLFLHEGGQDSVAISGLSEGTYTAYVSIEDDPIYDDNSTEVTFTVTKVEIPAEDAFNITTPENATSPEFTINLPEDATGYLLLDVNGTQTHVPLVNGTATASIPSGFAPGNYTAVVTYTGDDKYAPITTTKDITVESNVPDNAFTIPDAPKDGEPLTYSINLPSDAKGYLEVDVDGKTYVAALVNGSASITVPGLSAGDHNVTVKYTGDGKYSPVTKSMAVSVPNPVYKITNNNNVAVVYSGSASYKVLVTKDGKAIGAGQSVTITFNGKKYTVKTDSKGYAILKLNTKLKVKKYTITAQFKGVTVKNTVTIKQLIKAKNTKIKKSKKVNKIKVKTNKVNGKFLKGKKLTLKIKGKKVKAKINKKGVAVFKLKKSVTKKLKAGKTYKYTVSYGKDTITKKVKVKK